MRVSISAAVRLETGVALRSVSLAAGSGMLSGSVVADR